MQCVWKWVCLGDLLITAASEGELTLEQVQPTNELHRSNKVTKGLSFAIGNTTMPAPVRKSVTDAMGSHRGYLVTDSALLRGLVTAMNWLGSPGRACSPANLAQAVRDLGVPPGYTEQQVLDAVDQLKNDVIEELRQRRLAK